MIRRVLSFGFAASLVLCVVTAGLWVRSYFVADAFYNRRITAQSQSVRRWVMDGDALRGRFEVRLEYLHFWPRPAQPIPISLATASPRELAAIRRRAYLENLQAAAVFQRMSVEVSQTPVLVHHECQRCHDDGRGWAPEVGLELEPWRRRHRMDGQP